MESVSNASEVSGLSQNKRVLLRVYRLEPDMWFNQVLPDDNNKEISTAWGLWFQDFMLLIRTPNNPPPPPQWELRVSLKSHSQPTTIIQGP